MCCSITFYDHYHACQADKKRATTKWASIANICNRDFKRVRCGVGYQLIANNEDPFFTELVKKEMADRIEWWVSSHWIWAYFPIPTDLWSDCFKSSIAIIKAEAQLRCGGEKGLAAAVARGAVMKAMHNNVELYISFQRCSLGAQQRVNLLRKRSARRPSMMHLTRASLIWQSTYNSRLRRLSMVRPPCPAAAAVKIWLACCSQNN